MEYARFRDALISLSAASIKGLSHACGGILTGTKPLLISSLHDVVNRRIKTHSDPYRLISIDLGVKNIGISHVLIPPLDISKKQRPIAEKCYRASLPEAAVYAYPEFADMAINFTSMLIGNSEGPVDGIILERQRLHAISGNVPNHVVKANMMEAMVFTTLRVKYPALYLESIPPKSVLQFWKSQDDVVTNSSKDTVSVKYRRAKKARKDLLSNWLADPMTAPVDLGRTRIAQSIAKEGKGDDIADSLVQALTWSQWRLNSYILIENISSNADVYNELQIAGEPLTAFKKGN